MRVITISLCSAGDDGSIVISQWVARDSPLPQLIREQLGEPACEVLLGPDTVAAAETVLDASGAVVL